MSRYRIKKISTNEDEFSTISGGSNKDKTDPFPSSLSPNNDNSLNNSLNNVPIVNATVDDNDKETSRNRQHYNNPNKFRRNWRQKGNRSNKNDRLVTASEKIAQDKAVGDLIALQDKVKELQDKVDEKKTIDSLLEKSRLAQVKIDALNFQINFKPVVFPVFYQLYAILTLAALLVSFSLSPIIPFLAAWFVMPFGYALYRRKLVSHSQFSAPCYWWAFMLSALFALHGFVMTSKYLTGHFDPLQTNPGMYLLQSDSSFADSLIDSLPLFYIMMFLISLCISVFSIGYLFDPPQVVSESMYFKVLDEYNLDQFDDGRFDSARRGKITHDDPLYVAFEYSCPLDGPFPTKDGKAFRGVLSVELLSQLLSPNMCLIGDDPKDVLARMKFFVRTCTTINLNRFDFLNTDSELSVDINSNTLMAAYSIFMFRRHESPVSF